MNISVNQHIFSNVPKEKSPKKRRGYQTLFYTQDELTREEVLILEDRAQYYAGDTEPTKYQFHTLSDGKAVVSQVVPLEEPDEFGRKGRYLSHSLIISAADFQAMDYCPLSLFSPKSFVTNLNDVFQLGDKQSGDIRPKVLKVSDSWEDVGLQESHHWSSTDLEKLSRLGWQANRLREERKSVGMWGDTISLFKMLAVVFLLTAPEKRPFLTFDTHALDCDWTRDWPFWTWGGLDKNDRRLNFKIDAAIRQVEAELDSQHDIAFERWIVQNVIPQKLEHYIDGQEDVLRLNALLEGGRGDLSGIDQQFGQQFAQLNAPLIAKRILDYFPQAVGTSIKRQIKNDVLKEPWSYLQNLALGLTQKEVTEILYNLQFNNLGQSVDAEEQKAIARLADEAQHIELSSITKLRSGDLSGWQETLPQIQKNVYRLVVNRAVVKHAISVRDAFYPPYAAVWSSIAAKYMQPGELKQVLRQLKKYNGPFDPDSFLPLLPVLSLDDQKTLTKWLQSAKEPAPRLRAELKTPEPTSLMDKLKFWQSEPEKKRGKRE